MSHVFDGIIGAMIGYQLNRKQKGMMLQRRVISAAVALMISAVGLITAAAKTKDEIIEAENRKIG